MKPHKTNGGVCRHAVERVKKQYGSSLDRKHIRRILRTAKYRSGISEGRAVIDKELVKELKVREGFAGRVFLIAVGGGDVVTVIDEPAPAG